MWVALIATVKLSHLGMTASGFCIAARAVSMTAEKRVPDSIVPSWACHANSTRFLHPSRLCYDLSPEAYAAADKRGEAASPAQLLQRASSSRLLGVLHRVLVMQTCRDCRIWSVCGIQQPAVASPSSPAACLACHDFLYRMIQQHQMQPHPYRAGVGFAGLKHLCQQQNPPAHRPAPPVSHPMLQVV